MKKRHYFTFIALLIMGCAIAYVGVNFDFSVLLEIKWSSLAVGLLFLLVTLFFYALSTKILMRGLGYKRSFIDILSVNLVSHVGRVAISSKIDMPIKVYLNKKFLDIPYSAAVVIVSMRIFLNVFVVAINAAVLLLLIPGAQTLFPRLCPRCRNNPFRNSVLDYLED